MVNRIRPLYRLEKELRQGAPPPEEIRKRRQEESAVQVKEIFSAMEKRLSNTQNPPINALRRAIDYAMERGEMPESRLYAPNIPIDNNTAERAVRPVTIGRRSSRRGAELSHPLHDDGGMQEVHPVQNSKL